MPIGAALAWDDDRCEVIIVPGERHLSGEQDTRQETGTAAGPDRRAGSGADGERGPGRGQRVVRAARRDRGTGCGGRPGQAAGSRFRRWRAADRDRGGAAGRGGLPGRAGPPVRGCGWPADHPGAGPGVHDGGGPGPADHPGAVARRGGGAGGGDRPDAVAAARGAGCGAGRRPGHDRPGYHRRGGLRPQEARGGLEP